MALTNPSPPVTTDAYVLFFVVNVFPLPTLITLSYSITDVLAET